VLAFEAAPGNAGWSIIRAIEKAAVDWRWF